MKLISLLAVCLLLLHLLGTSDAQQMRNRQGGTIKGTAVGTTTTTTTKVVSHQSVASARDPAQVTVASDGEVRAAHALTDLDAVGWIIVIVVIVVIVAALIFICVTVYSTSKYYKKRKVVVASV